MLAKALQGATAAADKLYIEDVMSTYLYTGNGSTQTITNGIDLSGKGGLVWIKARSPGYSHELYDTARGVTNYLISSATNAQAADATRLTAFNSTGFTYGSGVGGNGSGDSQVSWTFRKAAKFFDVVTYTGNGGSKTINHGLGSTPGMVIIKRLDGTSDWVVWHRSLALANTAQGLKLNTTSAFGNQSGNSVWDSTSPMTSTTFSVGASGAGDWNTNLSGSTYVAYLFAHDAGGFGDSGNDSVVKCGSYTADGAGNFSAELGWEPQLVIFRDSSASAIWEIIDNMRDFSLANCRRLFPNLTNAEGGAGGPYLIPSSTGFRMVGSSSTLGATGIFIAIRRGPMKTPTDATKVFEAAAYTGNASNPRTVGTLSVTDLAVSMTRSTSGDVPAWIDRLRGGERYLDSSAVSAEAGGLTGWKLEQAGQIINSVRNTSSTTYVDWLFRRAPGFFDVVAYTGTGVARTVNHNLGVVPELMIVKSRSSGPAAPNWWVYCSAMPTPETSYLNLEGTGSRVSGVTVLWNSTNPTSSGFSLGTYSGVNGSTYTYIAYLFATLAGISKVGSYTGTGTTLNVDCGFTNGSRLVLIKRTDSTGDWYVWDTARGIISGNDPYLWLNSTAAEVTNTDYIDPLSSGFQISSTAPAAINANGGSYIYLSVA